MNNPPDRDLAPRLPTWKRALDLTAVAFAFPLLSLCAVSMFVLTSATSPGPLFFRQQRIGYRGRTFLLFKFRTMPVNVETDSHRAHIANLVHTNHPMEKMDNGRDPRLIPGGWLLRASGLDELPQIINVLRGEMSLVGPRPCVPYEFELYDEAQRRRFDAMPGLTGLWQVSGKNHTTFQTMIELDVAYARKLSLWQDLRIIVLTVPTVGGQVIEAALNRLRLRPAAARSAAALPARAMARSATRNPSSIRIP